MSGATMQGARLPFETHARCRGLFISATAFLAVFFAASGAVAQDGSSAQLMIRGTIAPRCSFTEVPAASNLGDLQTGREVDLGGLAFSCNLAESAQVSLTVQSQNGGLRRDGGTETVAYGAAWQVQGHGQAFQDAGGFASAVPFTLDSGPAGSRQGGLFRVKILGSTDSLVAGTYRDVITYTISP